MIYLLRSPAVVEEEIPGKEEKQLKYKMILKIGWTEDSKAEKRFKTYLSHNPSIQVLKTVPGIGIEVERALHSKFFIHRFPKTSEWYYDCAEIINFFSDPDLPLELKKIGLEVREKESEKRWKERYGLWLYLLRCLVPNPEFPFPVWSDDEFLNATRRKYGSEISLRLINLKESYKGCMREVKDVVDELARTKTRKKRRQILEECSREEWLLDLLDGCGFIEIEIEN